MYSRSWMFILLEFIFLCVLFWTLSCLFRLNYFFALSFKLWSCVCWILSSLASDSFLFLPWLPCSALLLFIVTLSNCAPSHFCTVLQSKFCTALGVSVCILYTVCVCLCVYYTQFIMLVHCALSSSKSKFTGKLVQDWKAGRCSYKYRLLGTHCFFQC